RNGATQTVLAHALGLGERVGDGEQLRLVAQQLDDFRITHGHGTTPSCSSSARSVSSARTKRIFAAASLTPSIFPISANRAPRTSFSTAPCRCASGSRASAALSAAVTSGPYSRDSASGTASSVGAYALRRTSSAKRRLATVYSQASGGAPVSRRDAA